MPAHLAASLPIPPDVPTSQRVARRAEELGFESIWIADTGAGPDAFVVAAAAAAVTESLRIGTAVVPAYTRAPAVMAAAAGSVGQLAPGRFVLGIGASSETIVERWSGIPFVRPVTRMRETTQVLRAMLDGDRVSFDGRTVRTQGFRLASPPPEPVPIYLAALMPAMLELAGEVADGVVLNMMPVEALPRMLEHVRAGAARAGRDPDGLEVVARFQTFVTDDVERARAVLRLIMGPYLATSVYNRFAAWCGFPKEAEAILDAWRAKDRARNLASVTDEMIDRIAIIGDAATCRARLEAFRAAGVTTPMIHPVAGDETSAVAMLEALAP